MGRTVTKQSGIAFNQWSAPDSLQVKQFVIAVWTVESFIPLDFVHLFSTHHIKSQLPLDFYDMVYALPSWRSQVKAYTHTLCRIISLLKNDKMKFSILGGNSSSWSPITILINCSFSSSPAINVPMDKTASVGVQEKI